MILDRFVATINRLAYTRNIFIIFECIWKNSKTFDLGMLMCCALMVFGSADVSFLFEFVSRLRSNGNCVLIVFCFCFRLTEK